MPAATAMKPDLGSFRDPAGRIYQFQDRIYRTVSEFGIGNFRQVLDSGILRDLADSGRCVETRVLSDLERAQLSWPATAGGSTPAEVLAHPLIPFISYPFEWSFEALRAAALAHLDLHLWLLKRGFTLSDASAFNMQFIGPVPIHIDVLSIVPHVEGERWAGYDQFKKHFLNPLVFEAATGVSFCTWYRGSMDGMTGADLVRLLPWKQLWRPSTLIHAVAPALFDRRAIARPPELKQPKLTPLPKSHLIALVESLRRIVLRLRARKSVASAWLDYETVNTYSSGERDAKRSAVTAFVRETQPMLLLDIGCNTGEYAEAALDAGAKLVIGAERDRAALDAAFKRALSKKLNFQALDLDIANPSPGQGWRGTERRPFTDRLKADGLLALAVLHHLVIANNIPLFEAVRTLVDLAPTGIIEFVPKSDSQVKRLLQLRSDIFHDYEIGHFESYLACSARIVSQARISESGRTLFRYERLSA